MPVPYSPEIGDIVIRKERREGALVYVVGTAHGSDQYLLRAREEAVAQARSFAKRQRVRAWLSDDGQGFELLEDFRVVERRSR